MYISVKERKSKLNSNSYYFYVCESKRIDGKVKNTQKYLLKLSYNELLYPSKLIDTLVLKVDLVNGFDSKAKEEIKKKLKVKIKEVKYKIIEDEYGAEYLNSFKEKYDNESQSNSNNYSYNYNASNNASNSNSYNYNSDLLKELIKAGYKQLSKKYHPDITGDDGTAMKELNKIYNLLKTNFDM